MCNCKKQQKKTPCIHKIMQNIYNKIKEDWLFSMRAHCAADVPPSVPAALRDTCIYIRILNCINH